MWLVIDLIERRYTHTQMYIHTLSLFNAHTHAHSETVSTHQHNKQIRGVHYDEPPPTPFARLTEVRDFRVLRVCDTFSPYPILPLFPISLSYYLSLLPLYCAPFASPFAELCDLFMRLEHKSFPYPTPFPYPIPFLYPSASGDICICVRRQQQPRTMNC